MYSTTCAGRVDDAGGKEAHQIGRHDRSQRVCASAGGVCDRRRCTLLTCVSHARTQDAEAPTTFTSTSLPVRVVIECVVRLIVCVRARVREQYELRVDRRAWATHLVTHCVCVCVCTLCDDASCGVKVYIATDTPSVREKVCALCARLCRAHRVLCVQVTSVLHEYLDETRIVTLHHNVHDTVRRCDSVSANS
jgi:hypothetical protein